MTVFIEKIFTNPLVGSSSNPPLLVTKNQYCHNKIARIVLGSDVHQKQKATHGWLFEHYYFKKILI